MSKLICNHNQNMQDLSIQGAGSIEHIFELALLNGIAVTDLPSPGSRLIAPIEKTLPIFEYCTKRRIVPITGSQKGDMDQQKLFENGLFENGLFE